MYEHAHKLLINNHDIIHTITDTGTVVSIRTDTTSIRFIVFQRAALNTSSTPTEWTVDSVITFLCVFFS